MAELESRFNPAEIEQRWYEFWTERGFFTPKVGAEADDASKSDDAPGRESYTIVIPPPNVTGILHVGHGLNCTLQDILVRWKRMQGFKTLWLPGTDHASIATETKVSQKLAAAGVKKRELGREKFLEHAWEWTREYGGAITGQLKKMGCSCDWTRERFTMDEQLSRAVRAAFKRLFDRGLIYRGKYLVNWCPTCRTVLSNDEVEHKEINGRLWHIQYPLKDSDERLTVATTRPETMLGDTAVAVNPSDERNKGLVGKTCILPLMNREIPIIADQHVDPEFGTGCVKVTPAHDLNDFEMGRRHELPMINILTEDGAINENGGAYAGLDRFAARKRVVADLKEQGFLAKVEDHRNAVGHCYRSGDIVEPFLSDQWFVKMKPLAEPAIAAVRDGRVRFTSKQYENTYYHWMENVRDWPISRQLYWGHRIPIWYRKDDRAQVICYDGEGVPPEVAAAPDAWVQEEDILDTWFSSALWPFSTLGWPEETVDLKTFYPTDVLVTAHEILFFWVARMIMMGLECMDKVPFSDVYIHAMVFDLKTRSKMSKSLGNIIDPLDMIDKFGADAMRYTFCAYAIQGRNIYLDEQRFAGYRNFMNKLWNASRFVMMNTEELKVEALAGEEQAGLKLEDRWILSRLHKTIATVNGHLTNYAFDSLGHDLYHFVWDDYCDWYVELCKPRLSSDDAEDRQAAMRTLTTVLETVLRLMHPIAPFVTEEIWQNLKAQLGATNESEQASSGEASGPGAVSRAALASEAVMVAAYPKRDDCPLDEAAERTIGQMQLAVTAARRLRAGVNVPPKEKTDVYLSSAAAEVRELLAKLVPYLEVCIHTEQVTIVESASEVPRGIHEDVDLGDEKVCQVHLPLTEEAVQRELARLNKELPKLEKGIKSISSKLSNEKFVANAKEEVVEKERKRLAELEAQHTRCKQTLLTISADS